jgi:hypothetical protein
VPEGLLPPGFVAIDLAKALSLTLHDPDNKNTVVAVGTYPKRGNGLIGPDPANPTAAVASSGGSDLVYVPGKDRTIVDRIVDALIVQDYVSGLFIDDELGSFPGTLPMSSINLKGSSRTPRPSIAINFRSIRLAASNQFCAQLKWRTPSFSRARACTAASAAPIP